MDCIIIEDQNKAAKTLETYLLSSGYPVNILTIIDSVEEAVPWLKDNHADLIFLDIQLGDGLGFEIFDHVRVKTPVVFTTSYDHYIAKSFQLNNIFYILKPVTPDSIKAALEKYHFLYPDTSIINEKILPLQQKAQQRFLVKNGNAFLSINVADVAYFYVQSKRYIFIVTKNKQQYIYDSTLDILEQRLDPSIFFRINRQFIISYDIIQQMSVYDERGRLKLETEPECKEEMIVSRYKATEFRHWLDR